MDCIFCKIVSGNVDAKILSETVHSISFLDAFPLAKGHVLVIPKSHHQKIQDMSKEENADLFSLVHTILSKVDSVTGATLMAAHNGKDAGQEVPHVHVHLVPRSIDDSAGAIHSMFDSDLILSESELGELHDELKV
ncbi:MAG: HIT domain-containing protein [Nitrosopumilus sp.]|nr:MAG: HIT domain-containing protein [Nitrosopumilus sp.]